MTFESHLFLDEAMLPASSEWGVPTPGCWRFVRLQSGQGYWMGQSGVRELAVGDVIVVSPKAQGVLRASQLNEVTLLFFRFCPEQLTGLLTLAERHNFEAMGQRTRLAVHVIPAANPLAERFAALCALKPRNSLRQRCQMLELAGTVFAEEMPAREPRSSRIASARDRFQEMIRLMPEADIIKHTPEELAQRCGCSLRHFSRLFRRQLGVSIRTKQTSLRLQKAAQMLRDTQTRISQVALEAGYRHVGLFYSMFKKQFGMTPTEWRERALREGGSGESPGVRVALIGWLLTGVAGALSQPGFVT